MEPNLLLENDVTNPTLPAAKYSKLCIDKSYCHRAVHSSQQYHWDSWSLHLQLPELRAGKIQENLILRVANTSAITLNHLCLKKKIISSLLCCGTAWNSLGAPLVLIGFTWEGSWCKAAEWNHRYDKWMLPTCSQSWCRAVDRWAPEHVDVPAPVPTQPPTTE